MNERIEAKYREVLSRPKFEINEERLEAFLAVLQFQDWVTAMPWSGNPPPDKDDTLFLEVAAEVVPPILVTGNRKHYPQNCRGRVSVLSPQEAWRRFADLQCSVVKFGLLKGQIKIAEDFDEFGPELQKIFQMENQE